jgi:hypothetical protein
MATAAVDRDGWPMETIANKWKMNAGILNNEWILVGYYC